MHNFCAFRYPGKLLSIWLVIKFALTVHNALNYSHWYVPVKNFKGILWQKIGKDHRTLIYTIYTLDLKIPKSRLNMLSKLGECGIAENSRKKN